MEDILKQLTVIFRDVLDNDDLVITESTIADDVEEWDSLNHIQLVVAIEKHFKVKFTTQEIMQWKNVGEIAASIKKRLAS
jgi:acyl carrier protein